MFHSCLGGGSVVCPGSTEGGGPAPAEAVRYSSCSAAVHQLPEPEPVTLTDLETDEATHAGRTGSKESDLECCLQFCWIIIVKSVFWLEL